MWRQELLFKIFFGFKFSPLVLQTRRSKSLLSRAKRKQRSSGTDWSYGPGHFGTLPQLRCSHRREDSFKMSNSLTVSFAEFGGQRMQFLSLLKRASPHSYLLSFPSQIRSTTNSPSTWASHSSRMCFLFFFFL